MLHWYCDHSYITVEQLVQKMNEKLQKAEHFAVYSVWETA